MNIGVDGVFCVDLVPERRGWENCVSPVTTDLCTEVCKVIFEIGCEGADVDEDLGWEFVDGCQRVSDRSDGAGSFNQDFFSANDLMRRTSQMLGPEETTEGLGGVLLRGKGSNPCYRSRSLLPRVLGESARTNSQTVLNACLEFSLNC